MDSQLASVLTSGSLDVQNGSQSGEGSGPETEVYLDPEDSSSASTVTGNLQPCPVKEALTIRQDALSINGKKPEVGGSSRPASQETCVIGGLRQPITVKTGVPVLHSQPIRIKIVVPPRCKGPITNSAISLTKDFAHSQFRGPLLLSAGPVTSEKEGSKIHISAVQNEGEVMEVTCEKTEEKTKAESFQRAQSGDSVCKERDVLDVKIVHIDDSETTFISTSHAAKISNQQIVKGEAPQNDVGKITVLKSADSNSCEEVLELGGGEQTEPLDLSLPKKRESRERRCGRFLDDSGCESSLIMEVDEYEGEGDRDIVEEDEDTSVLCLERTDMFDDSLLSPSFFSTSVLASLSSVDCDTENLLLIDDQGIPYTLSPDGLKVPQVNASTSRDPQSNHATSHEAEGAESSPVATLAGTDLSQSFENALNAPSGDSHPSPASPADSPLQDVDRTEGTISNRAPPVAAESSVSVDPEAKAVLNPPPGMSAATQPIQILANPSINAPILLLSSSSSSSQPPPTPVSLSLPLSVTQTPPCASSPVFLLLSSVPSSSGEPTSTSTPIAVLDPSTGHLSQITAASAPVSLPVSSGQVGASLPTLSHPVIRLSPNNAPLILSSMNTLSSGSVLTSLVVPSPGLAVQDDQSDTGPFAQTQISYSDSNPGSEAIPAEEVSKENNKPSAPAASAPQSQSAAVNSEPLTQPGSEAEAQSPASDSNYNPPDPRTEHLPLDDHLYFSNAAAPPSPSIGPVFPSDKLDPLDPLSPEESPNSLGSRRVLYCQLCPRVFFYLSDLERHAITHSQKKPHVCQQCGKAFKRSSHLQRHKHIHTGQRNFVCPICAKRFREAGELQRHQRVHTGEKPYQCQLCHTRFAERNTLRRHTKRKHPYHQAAMEMLSERRDAGGGRGDARGGSGVREEEESAEWYSSTVSTLDNSESEAET